MGRNVHLTRDLFKRRKQLMKRKVSNFRNQWRAMKLKKIEKEMERSGKYASQLSAFDMKEKVGEPDPKEINRIKCLTEEEWRTELGLQMSRGWENFCLYQPELMIMCFRRPLPP